MKTIMSTTLVMVAGTALLSATLAAPKSGPVPAARKAAQVNIDNFKFTPATLTVPVGTRVTWLNHDDVPHTIVSTDGRFKSPALDTDEKFAYTFHAKGTYAYFCSVHPMMTAQVIVH